MNEAEITITELEKIVAEIEMDIHEATGKDHFNVLVSSNGSCIIIDFIGIRIWDSENDDRDYIDDGHNHIYEPIRNFIRARINEEIEDLSKIVLK